MFPIRRLCACFLLLFAASAAAHAAGGKFAIVGADVLPMTSRARLENQTVLVEDGRIVKVGPRGKVRVPAGYRRIEAAGQTLMPGLVDMHAHVADDPGAKGDRAWRALSVLLAHGVTTARSMVGAPGHPALRARIERGEVVGPRLYIGAPGLSSSNTPDVASGREKVAAAKRDGFDFVKLFGIGDPDVWEAVRESSAAAGLPLSGHVINSVGLGKALAARMQVEHLDGTLYELLPENSATRQVEFGQFPPGAISDEAARAATPDRIAALAARVAASGSYQTPTLALFVNLADPDADPARLRRLPEMRYVPAAALDAWAQQIAAFGSFDREEARRFLALRKAIVAAYHKAGVPILAGSDSPQGFHMLGIGLIRELEALVDAGLSPMEALRSATVVPRDYFRTQPNDGSALGWKADFGTVEPGARADLILLESDPSADVGALRQLSGVMTAGVWRDRAALDAMLDEVARTANPPQAQ